MCNGYFLFNILNYYNNGCNQIKINCFYLIPLSHDHLISPELASHQAIPLSDNLKDFVVCLSGSVYKVLAFSTLKSGRPRFLTTQSNKQIFISITGHGANTKYAESSHHELCISDIKIKITKCKVQIQNVILSLIFLKIPYNHIIYSMKYAEIIAPN